MPQLSWAKQIITIITKPSKIMLINGSINLVKNKETKIFKFAENITYLLQLEK